MNWEQEAVMDNVRQCLSKIRKMDADGEVDFRLLSMLAESREGWLGQVLNSLYSAFAEDSETGKAVSFLEEAAAILIAWAADVKHRDASRPSTQSNQVGASVLVRLPDHHSRYLGVVTTNNQIWVEILNKHYAIEEVRILSKSVKPTPQQQISESLQDAIREQLEKISQQFR